MYRYTVWPGAYSFKEECSLFLLYIKEQFEELMKKIKSTEKVIDK